MFLCAVGFELYFATYPIRTLSCNGLLRQFVAELYFKLTSRQTTLTIKTRDVKFTLSFIPFLCNKGGRSEDKAKFLYLL